jgi:APA family basic amino acid/polyamine antiporter
MKRKTLSLVDAVAIIIGIVVGVGIFKTPSLVAANTSSVTEFMLFWVLGGAISLLGALCYAELATAYPHAGGDYHFVRRAFGKRLSFLFAWSRMTVIQAGSIAMLAFVFGDYMSQTLPLGNQSHSIYAALGVVALTTLNMIGIREGKWTQNLLTGVKVLGLLTIFLASMAAAPQSIPSIQSAATSRTTIGLAMIFVLLTYGGWNEAAYVSAELKEIQRNMVRALLWGISLITVTYLLVNLAFARILGMAAMSQSEAVASDAMRRVAGSGGAAFIGALICISALGAMNATIITGARTNYALGRAFRLFRHMGGWNENAGTPANALIVQGIISLLLILLGTLTRKGFVTIVEYTAPVFWFFFLLATCSLIVLRFKEPQAVHPFSVPLYPVTPLVFAGVCIFMLISSIEYTGIGALVGIAVLLAGVPFLLVSTHHDDTER